MTALVALDATEMILGPLGALALCLVGIGLLVKGTLHSRNTVPREDYDKLFEGLKTITTALETLVVVVRAAQKNGGL